MRDTLDAWPLLPLGIIGIPTEGVGDHYDDIVAVLERRDRLDGITLWNADSSPLENVLAAIQVPFPEPMHLQVSSKDETVPILPDSFLGGSAPRLESL